MSTLYEIGHWINECRTSSFGGADMEDYLSLEDVEFLYNEVLALREALRKIRAMFRAAEEFGFPKNGWKVGSDMAELAEKMLGYPIYAAPWPAPSNITSSRPPELAGLWDSAESEPVAVNPAAADANR